jgi:hypothetical protein
MKSLTSRQQVILYCKQMGVRVNGKGGIPMLGNDSGSWVECFDGWDEALKYLSDAHRLKIDESKPFPWAK